MSSQALSSLLQDQVHGPTTAPITVSVSTHTVMMYDCLSAYEMKNFVCVFERPFKIQKNGVFLFEISFFVLEILTFFCYAN